MVKSVPNGHIVGIYRSHIVTEVSLQDEVFSDTEEELKRQGNLRQGYFIDDGVITHHFPSDHMWSVPDDLEQRIKESPSHNFIIYNGDTQPGFDKNGWQTLYYAPQGTPFALLKSIICGAPIKDWYGPSRYDT